MNARLLFFGAVALLLTQRLVLWLGYLDTPIPTGPISDSWLYLTLADERLKTGFWSKEVVFHPPLYPYIVAFLRQWSPNAPFLILAVQNIFGLLTSIIILDWSRRISNDQRLWVLTFLLLLFSGRWVWVEWRLFPESLTLFFEVAAIECIWRLQRSQGRWIWVIALALALGILPLLRANFLIALPMFWIYIWSNKGTSLSVSKKLAIAIIPLLTIFPFSLRNHRLGAGWGLAANSGVTFFLGNQVGASGGYTSIEGVANDILSTNADAMRVANTKDIRESNRYWWSRSANEIATHPLDLSVVFLKKLILFFSPNELGGDIRFDVEKRHIPPLFFFSLIPFTLAIALAALRFKDLCASSYPATPTLLLSLVTPITCVLFLVLARYRIPIWPLLILPAAISLHSLRRRGWTLVATALLAFVAYDFATRSEENYADRHNWGVAWLHSRDLKAATTIFEGILRDNPRFIPSMESLAEAYLEIGYTEKALSVLKQLVEADPNSYVGWNNLTVAAIRERRWKDAVQFGEKALTLRPDRRAPFINLAAAHFQLGELEVACDYTKRASKWVKLSRELERYSRKCESLKNGASDVR